MKKLNWPPARLLAGLVCKNIIKMTEVISRAREMAMKRIAMEEECLRLAKEEERFRIEAVEKARKEFATEQRRQIDAEMAEARLRAQQAVAEAEAQSIKDAEEAEIAKEIARLKARTPVEVLQDELEQMRATMAEMAVGYKALLAEKMVVPPPVPVKVVEEGWKWMQFTILTTCGQDEYTEFARLIFDDDSYVVESVKSDFQMGSPGEGPENLIGSSWVQGKKWCARKNGGNPSITIKFSKPLKATKYAFITSPHAQGHWQRIPSTFQLTGSNDNINWEVIGNGCQCALPANTQSEWKSIKPYTRNEVVPLAKNQQKVPIAVYGGLLGYQGISNIIISQGTNRYSFGCVTTTFAGQAHIILVINLDTEMNLISANKISHCNTNKEEVDFTKEVALLCGVEPIASPRTFSISASNGSFGDPAVGHGKKLVINYRAMDTTGNLRDFEASAFEHDTCSFTVAGMSGFEIIKATWGNSHGCCGGSSNRCGRGGSISFSDVTGKVKSMCQ